MKNIVVAINREKNAPFLVAKAEEIARAFNSKIWILHVAEPDPDDFLGLEAGPQYAQDERVAKRKSEGALVKKLAASLQEKDLAAEGLLIEGPTTKTIKQKVSDLHADLVIVGNSTHNFFYQMFVGNIEQEIVGRLKVPVLLVPVH